MAIKKNGNLYAPYANPNAKKPHARKESTENGKTVNVSKGIKQTIYSINENNPYHSPTAYGPINYGGPSQKSQSTHTAKNRPSQKSGSTSSNLPISMKVEPGTFIPLEGAHPPRTSLHSTTSRKKKPGRGGR